MRRVLRSAYEEVDTPYKPGTLGHKLNEQYDQYFCAVSLPSIWIFTLLIYKVDYFLKLNSIFQYIPHVQESIQVDVLQSMFRQLLGLNIVELTILLLGLLSISIRKRSRYFIYLTMGCVMTTLWRDSIKNSSQETSVEVFMNFLQNYNNAMPFSDLRSQLNVEHLMDLITSISLIKLKHFFNKIESLLLILESLD